MKTFFLFSVLLLVSCEFFAQDALWQPHPVGPQSALKESWGQGILPAFLTSLTGNLTADNTWFPSQGTTYSLVALNGSSGCTKNPQNWSMAETKALNLAANATAPILYAGRSFPAIAAGSTVDIDIGFCVSAATSAFNYEGLSTLKQNGGNQNSLTFTYSGSTLSLIGCNNGCGSMSAATTVSLGTWHRAHLHQDATAANCYHALDNGTHHTFTCSAMTGPQQIFSLVGPTASGPILIGKVTVDASTNQGYYPPSILVDGAGQGSAGTATLANLAAGSHGGPGAWTVAASGITWSTIPGATSLYQPLVAAGIRYLGNTGVWLQHDLSQSYLITYGLLGAYTQTGSFAEDINFNGLACSGTNVYNIGGLISADGSDYEYVQEGVSGANCVLYLHAPGCSGGVAAMANIPNMSAIYRIEAQYNAGGTHYMSFYTKASPPVLVGSASCAASGSHNLGTYYFGHAGSNLATGTTYIFGANIAVDFVTGAYPNL